LIHDTPVNFLIDSGSSVCVLTLAFEKHPAFEPCTVPAVALLTADARSIKTTGHLSVPVSVEGRAYAVDFVVADVKSNILGANFLLQHKLALLMNPVRLIPEAELQLAERVNTLHPASSRLAERVNALQAASADLQLGVVSPTIDDFFRRMRERYPSVFSTELKFNDSYHGITFQIAFDKKPKQPYIYQVPLIHREAVMKKMDLLLQAGIIRPSDSPF